MKPLTLTGKAKAVETGPDNPNHHVLRLVDPAAFARGEAGPRDAILVTARDAPGAAAVAKFAVFVGDRLDGWKPAASISLGDEFGYLAPGDIIGAHLDTGRVRTLYRRSSRHNSFLTTERCNHYCLMCSPPPKEVNDGWLLDEIAEALPLIDPATPYIGFTGGEPLLEWRRIIELLALARETLPRTAIHLLTNGRGFADPQIADAWAAVAHPDLCSGIPIYAAIDRVHDYVV